MSDRPQAGDLYIVVDEMPSGGTWGHPFSVDPDTWLVKVKPVEVGYWCEINGYVDDRHCPTHFDPKDCGGFPPVAIVKLEATDEPCEHDWGPSHAPYPRCQMCGYGWHEAEATDE